MLLALLIAIALAGAVLLGARRMRLRYRLAVAAALIILGLVPMILAFVVSDKPLPGAQTADPRGHSK